MVTVDVSGKRFDRMSGMRRSLMTAGVAGDGGVVPTPPDDGSTVRRRTKTRKPRNRRRNTLAGTDQKEIRDALTAAYVLYKLSLKIYQSIDAFVFFLTGKIKTPKSRQILRNPP